MKKFKISKIFKKKKQKRRRKFSKKALGLGVFGSYFLGCFKKKKKIINQNFQFLQKKFRVSKFFPKKKNPKFSIPLKNSSFPNSKKKKKKKSSLNSSTGTESYNLLPHSPVMQHQVNNPPSAFIEAWSMSQTRGIRQVCQCLFNE